MVRILVLHGPNLNLLGKRETERYGLTSLQEIDKQLMSLAKAQGVALETRQSNSEGTLVDHIQDAAGKFDAIVINPAAYTHTSIAIRDAILSVDIPTVEVHLSNIQGREDFRRSSFIADIAVGQITGFGSQSYLLGLLGAIGHVQGGENPCSLRTKAEG